MPESNHEVIIDGYVYPDTVTITLANDDFAGSRDYVSKDLYESVDAANEAWQKENAKLRELVRIMAYCMQYERECDECRMNGVDGAIAKPVGCVGLLDCMRELGIEVDK